MDKKVWNCYEDAFECKVVLDEPGGFIALDKKTERLYDLSEFSNETIENLMRESVNTNRNVLIDSAKSKEIPRFFNNDTNIVF